MYTIRPVAVRWYTHFGDMFRSIRNARACGSIDPVQPVADFDRAIYAGGAHRHGTREIEPLGASDLLRDQGKCARPSVPKESQSDHHLDQSDRSISFPVRSRALSATRSLRFFRIVQARIVTRYRPRREEWPRQSSSSSCQYPPETYDSAQMFVNEPF